MKAKKILSVAAAAALAALPLYAQSRTAASLFLRSDSLQVEEVVSDVPVLFESVGHNGPAVENLYFALRMYFNDSGAIDLYCKDGTRLELETYKWYPTPEQSETEGAGVDPYDVGRTLGFGGIALWDGGRLVRLKATAGRTARVGRTRDGAYAELIAYGVEFQGQSYDISMRIEMRDKDRDARLTVTELSGKSLPFVCGLAARPGDRVEDDRRYISVWSRWSPNDGSDDVEFGTGIKFRPGSIARYEKTDGMLLLVCRPTDKAVFRLCAASNKESELDTYDKFASYMRKHVFSL